MVRAGIAEFVVEDLVVLPRGEDAAGGGESGLDADLRRLAERIGRQADLFVAALGERDIMYRRLTRPFADRRKIMETIGPEVETMLPVLDSRPVFDFVVTGRDAEGAYVIQAFCAKSSRVEQLTEVMKTASLDPEIVDCPSVAIAAGAARIFDLPVERGVVVLHIGWDETSAAILVGGELRYAGAIPFGYARIAASKDAESRGGSLEGEGQAEGKRLQAQHEKEAADLFREILIMLERAAVAQGDLLCIPTGYARHIADLERHMKETLGMELHEPALLQDTQFEGDVEDLKEEFLAVSLACRGVASENPLNFRQGDSGMSRRIGRVMGVAGPWLKAALVLFVLWTAGVMLDVGLKMRTDRVLSARISSEFVSVMPKGTPMVDPVRQMEQYLSRLTAQAGGAAGAGTGTPLDLLKDLSAGVPREMDVVVDSVNMDGDNITISASASKYDDVEKIQRILAALPYVKEVKIVQANVDKNDQKVKMRLTCRRQA
jgi:hypothetical protein